MSKKLLLFFTSIFIVNTIYSTIVWSKNDSVPSDSVKQKKTKFVFSFDARQSWVLKQSVKFSGFKIGLEYKKKHRFGLGLYSLSNPIILPNNIIIIKNPDSLYEEIDTVNYLVNFNYSTLYYEWVFYERKRWEFSSSFHLGTGRVNIGFMDKYDRDSTLINFRIPIGALSVAGHYKIFPWIGLGAGFGYRFALVGDKRVTDALNGFHTIFKVKLFLGDLYRGFFKRKDGYRLTYKKCSVCA